MNVNMCLLTPIYSICNRDVLFRVISAKHLRRPLYPIYNLIDTPISEHPEATIQDENAVHRFLLHYLLTLSLISLVSASRNLPSATFVS